MDYVGHNVLCYAVLCYAMQVVDRAAGLHSPPCCSHQAACHCGIGHDAALCTDAQGLAARTQHQQQACGPKDMVRAYLEPHLDIYAALGCCSIALRVLVAVWQSTCAAAALVQQS
jgi:hypothetical protein